MLFTVQTKGWFGSWLKRQTNVDRQREKNNSWLHLSKGKTITAPAIYGNKVAKPSTAGCEPSSTRESEVVSLPALPWLLAKPIFRVAPRAAVPTFETRDRKGQQQRAGIKRNISQKTHNTKPTTHETFRAMKYASVVLFSARFQRGVCFSWMETNLCVCVCVFIRCPRGLIKNLRLPSAMPVTTKIKTTAVRCIVISSEISPLCPGKKEEKEKSGRCEGRCMSQRCLISQKLNWGEIKQSWNGEHRRDALQIHGSEVCVVWV